MQTSRRTNLVFKQADIKIRKINIMIKLSISYRAKLQCYEPIIWMLYKQYLVSALENIKNQLSSVEHGLISLP